MSRAAQLSQDELDALLAWLAPCRDQAGERYEAIRRALLRFFESRNCGAAEEHADETIDRVARRVAGGEHIRVDPYRYCRGVAKKIFLEAFRRRPNADDLQVLTRETPPHPQERVRYLDDCLRTLPARTRELLEAYYLGNRAALAATLGITPNALRLRVFKEKQKLRAEISGRNSALRGEASEPRC